MTPKPKTQSGLAWSTIRRHAGSEMMERDRRRPVYMHKKPCDKNCDEFCNGMHGLRIAIDVDTWEQNVKR